MSWGRRAASCAIAAMLAFGVCPAFAEAGVQPAPRARLSAQDLAAVPLPDADGASDDPAGGADAPASPPDDGEETAVDRARRLIDAIPYDPYKVTPDDADAIRAAESAYASLSEAEQRLLDEQESASGVLTYGRALQCASWGLDALAPVDDTTPLADGTYTKQVTSTCEMGKSSSVRGYKFTVAKVTVKDGRATATLEHATASPDTVSTGGVVYPHSNTDEKARSTFEVPVDLNSTFHLSQMAKNPTANTIAIPYEMTVAVDEEKAVPDPAPSGSGGKGDSAGAPGAGKKPSNPEKPFAGKTPGAKEAAAQPRDSQPAAPVAATPVPAAPAVAVAAGAGGSGKAAASQAGAGAAAQQAASAPAEGSVPSGVSEAAATVDAAQADGQAGGPSSAPGSFQAIAICAAALLAIGLAAFPLDYLRRDRKPVRVSGVRLSDTRR